MGSSTSTMSGPGLCCRHQVSPLFPIVGPAEGGVFRPPDLTLYWDKIIAELLNWGGLLPFRMYYQIQQRTGKTLVHTGPACGQAGSRAGAENDGKIYQSMMWNKPARTVPGIVGGGTHGIKGTYVAATVVGSPSGGSYTSILVDLVQNWDLSRQDMEWEGGPSCTYMGLGELWVRNAVSQ